MNYRAIALTAAFFMQPILSAQSIAERVEPQPRTVVVTGNGEAAAAPDQAIVRLGASAQTAEAETSHQRVSEIMNKALEAIEKLGVPKKAIRTSGLSLQPVYASDKIPNPGEGPRVSGFRAANTLQITLDDPGLVGKVIDAGLRAGANELQGVSFGLKNDLPQRTAALTAASQEARVKAQTIAKALDLELGGVREVNEGGVHVMPQNEYFGGARMMAAQANVRTPVEPGEVRVQASVTVHYDIVSAGKH
jgi:uncharacterized protein YggE